MHATFYGFFLSLFIPRHSLTKQELTLARAKQHRTFLFFSINIIKISLFFAFFFFFFVNLISNEVEQRNKTQLENGLDELGF